MELQNSEKILKWLKTTRIPLTEISSKTGLSRSTLYNWLEGGVIRRRNESKLLSVYSTEIELTNTSIQLEGDENMDARYVIELQKDKIDHLNSKIKDLKTALKEKQAESTHWDTLPYDYISEVTLIRDGFKFGRRIDSVTDLEKQSSVLGYSVKKLQKLWDIGKYYAKIGEHPIDSIVSKETQLRLYEQIKTLPAIFDTMKSMVGDHYIPNPLVYKHKDGHNIGAIAYCKVEWLKMKVIAKVQYLTD